MKFKHLLLFITAAVSLANALHAETRTAPSVKNPPFEFRITAWNIDLPELFFEQDGKKIPAPVIERNLTPSFTYVSSTGKLVLYTRPVADGVSTKTEFAELTLVPPPSKNIILLWREKSGSYGHAVLADDPKSPPPGNLRLVNLSGQNLAFVCNKQETFTLSPGADKVVAPSENGVGVGVKIARQHKKPQADVDPWQLVLMTSIRIAPDQRVTAFIADPERLSLSVRKKSIADHLDKEQLSLFFIRDTVTK